MISKNEPIRLIMILEIIGRPAEHLTSTLNDLIKQIENERGVKIFEKKVNEPVEIKEQKGFYSSFAEVEVETEEASYAAALMFKYMPSHVEIISPEHISVTNNIFGDILNELVRRLHGYDEIARVLTVEKQILENKLREVLGKKTVGKEDKKKTKE